MPIFEKDDNGITRIAQELGRIGIIRMMFEAARETNPQATLLINAECVKNLQQHCLKD